MAANYKVVKLSGTTSFFLPVTEESSPSTEKGTPEGRSKSPEWMIKMDDDLASTIENFEGYSELYGWYGQAKRETSGDLANRLFTSASIQHSNLVFQIPNGGYNPKIETKMNTGVEYQSIEIIRLGNIKSTSVKLQEIKFAICRVQSVTQELDRLVVETIITRRENTVFVYDNDGNNKGQVVSSADYAKNKAS